MKIKDLVKSKRLLLKETQADFGKRFNLSHAAISDLESGKTKSIQEDMLNFVLEKCQHIGRTYRETVITKCIECGFEQEQNMKLNNSL
jgi:transcriptional regulator with XRE-family HTH domain